MKYTNILKTFGAFMANASISMAYVKDIFKDQVCWKGLDEAKSFTWSATGDLLMNNGSQIDHGNHIEDDDIGNFALMGNQEMEYSMPYSLKVCSNSERIFGLQLILGMHREPFDNEDEIIE